MGENVRSDMLTLGKAISGGLYPVSAVVGVDQCMDVLTPGTHGSTYGGNPLGTSIAITALEVLREEGMAENAQNMGEYLREELTKMSSRYPFMKIVRGKGLLNAVVCDENHHHSAWEICLELAKNGLLAKPTHDHIIRFAPPLVINKEQVDDCLQIMENSFRNMS